MWAGKKLQSPLSHGPLEINIVKWKYLKSLLIRKYNLSVEIKIQKENFTLSLLHFKLKLDHDLICIDMVHICSNLFIFLFPIFFLINPETGSKFNLKIRKWLLLSDFLQLKTMCFQLFFLFRKYNKDTDEKEGPTFIY